MDKIKQLIDQQHPTSVEYKTLGKVCKISSGYPFKKQFFNQGTNKVIRISDIKPTIEIASFSGIFSSENPGEKYKVYQNDLIMGLSGTVGKLGKITSNQGAYINQRIARFEANSYTDFIYHVLQTTAFKTYLNEHVSGAVQQNISIRQISQFRIPFPPLQTQKKIVKILDDLLKNTNTLIEKLKDECVLRQQHYAYYRQKLFTFPNQKNEHVLPYLNKQFKKYGVKQVVYKPLREVALWYNNKRLPITKNVRTPGAFPYYGANGILDYVNDYLFDGTFLLVGEDGSVIRENGTPIVHWVEGKFWVNNHAHILTSKNENQLNLRFLYFYLSSISIHHLITNPYRPKLNKQNIEKIHVPLPPLSIQEEIVSILDNLESLTNKLSATISMEIEARKKQYDYFRNILLSFP